MLKKKTITIICPFLNEEKNLEIFYTRLKNTLSNIDKLIEYKIAFINDGSTDKSEDIINKIKKKDEVVSLINFTKNFGHQNAILAGLENFDSDYYITLDTDLQMPTEIIVDMVKNIQSNNYQIVFCSPTNFDYEKKFKKILSFLFYKLFSFLTDFKIENTSDYWIITKKIRDLIINNSLSQSFIRGFIHSTGHKKLLINYTKAKRIEGKSKYYLLKQIELGLNGIYINFKKIYVYVFLFALFFFIFGLIYFIWIWISYFKGSVISGWTSLALILTITGTIIVITNSIIIFFLQKIISIVSKEKKYIIE
jgi:dolichol-phosphate mannosyltransferase